MNNKEYKTYTISSNNITIELTNLGAIMKRILVQHNNQELDIVLGFDNEQDYLENDSTYFGAVIGRNANRIEDSIFNIEGTQFHVESNEGNHNLHSGSSGFHTRKWDVVSHNEHSITFSLLSPHLDQGFPGKLKMEVTYALIDDNALEVTYKGQSDRLTVFNPTNHSYFNLNGHDSGDVLHHKLWLNSDKYSELNDESIPTGKQLEVTDTNMDFTNLRMISEDKKDEYDDNFILNSSDIHQKVATLIGDVTGIQMDVYTNSPCIQLYTGNGLDDVHGKNGTVYNKHAGVCLETQFEPNSVNSNHPPLIDGKLEYKTIYKFSGF
ncbi:galactose mutarotase [Macrococcus epidermidis]|uniref:aldose epimerase family protein n=1 Tax=Macrococcus epidermidis TaxID=1902580 RepID=UPI001EF19BD7|nr:aldose epimerase family protein [Macrococcus epidermidis]MCG7421164.1 galactose mutarotase [Macrococcus epidermidis]